MHNRRKDIVHFLKSPIIWSCLFLKHTQLANSLFFKNFTSFVFDFLYQRQLVFEISITNYINASKLKLKYVYATKSLCPLNPY